MNKTVYVYPLYWIFRRIILTPSFGNHLFANYHVHKHPITNLMLSSLYIPQVLKSVAKIMEISSQLKIERPKIIWTRAFSIVKMLPREVTVTIIPEKKKNFKFFVINTTNQCKI